MVWLKRSFFFLVILMVFLVPAEGEVHQGVRIWDTKSLLGVEIDINEREDWEIIQPLITNHSFQGDVVLENERLLLLFSSEKGNLFLHSKEVEKGGMVEIILLDPEGARASSIHSTEILKNSDDEVALEVTFLTQGNQVISQAFSLGREKRFVEIKPLKNAGAVQVHAPTRFTIIPAFGSTGGDYQDVVFNPRSYPVPWLLLPSENIILNLLEGENEIVVITWTGGEQRVSALLSGEGESRLIEATEATFAQQNIYVGILAAPGIWHEVKLEGLPFLKDITLDWRRAFPAGWKINFYAERRSLSKLFRQTRSACWHPAGVGWFFWPWFEEEKTMFQLNKRVLKDNIDIALIYPLKRGKATPAGVDTPSDILRQTLGDNLWNSIQARGKRIPLQVEPWPGERPAILTACAANAALTLLIKRGLATEQPFMVDLLVNGIINARDWDLRLDEGYILSIQKIKEFINVAKGDNPAVNSFLERMEKIIQELEKERYETRFRPWLEQVGKEDVQWEQPRAVMLGHALEVREKMKRLAREGSPEELIELEALRLKLISGWVHEPLFRIYLRRLQQEAIIVAAGSGEPEVMKVAEEIRRLAREARRNPGWGF